MSSVGDLTDMDVAGVLHRIPFIRVLISSHATECPTGFPWKQGSKMKLRWRNLGKCRILRFCES